MADTTKEQVLLIAPELENKVTDKQQKDLITVAIVVNSTNYTVTLNGVDYTANSGVGATEESIIIALIAAITSAAVTMENRGDGSFYIIMNEAATTVLVECSSNLVLTAVDLPFAGDTLFSLILADAIIEITEERYDTEEERAQRYLIAHILTLANIDPENVDNDSNIIKAAVGDVQYERGSGSGTALEEFYAQTSYGLIFYQIWLRHYFRFI